jgi:hypothetical protein
VVVSSCEGGCLSWLSVPGGSDAILVVENAIYAHRTSAWVFGGGLWRTRLQ